jgi:hypothetical protein
MERAAKWCRRRPAVAGLLALVVLLAAVGGGLGIWLWHTAAAEQEARRLKEREEKTRALDKVDYLPKVAPVFVPNLLANWEPHRADVLRHARRLWDMKGGDEAQRMRFGLALLKDDPEVRKELAGWLLKAEEPAEVLLFRDALAPYKEELTEGLWAKAKDAKAAPAERLRALTTLASYDPKNGRWQKLGDDAVGLLLAANPFYLGQWAAALKPVRAALLEPLGEAFRRGTGEQRQAAALVLADYASDDADRLANLLHDADDRQRPVLQRVLKWLEAQRGQRMP